MAKEWVGGRHQCLLLFLLNFEPFEWEQQTRAVSMKCVHVQDAKYKCFCYTFLMSE